MRATNPAITAPATAADVNRALGDVDPLIVERIIQTGATAAEVAEALRESLDEHDFAEESHEPSSPRVAEVRAVLDELVLADDEEELEQG
jgi:hypothetical protein